MNKINRVILLGATTLSALALISCGSTTEKYVDQYGKEVVFYEREEKTGAQFLEGSSSEVEYTNTIYFDDYLLKNEDTKYTLKITGPDGFEKDFSKKKYWNPDVPGDYQLIYTVTSDDYKGTATFDLKIKAPELSWVYSPQGETYLVGQEINFEEYFSKMNIFVDSYYESKVVMDSVEFGDTVVDLHNQSSFLITSIEDHLFKFHVEATDGQIAEGREIINIKYIDEDYLQQLTDMNVSLYGEIIVKEDEFVMKKGSYNYGLTSGVICRENGPHDNPYIAYNGDYGLGSLLQIDFTGNNMPIVSFFRDDDYSKNMFDGTKGIAFANGWMLNDGKMHSDVMCGRITFYGPYMAHYIDRDSTDTTRLWTIANNCPGSMNTLDADTHYRLICGITSVDKDYAFTFEMYLLNLDTMEIVANSSHKSYAINKLDQDNDYKGDGKADYHVDDSYFTGNIVLYGRIGAQTKIDKLYPIITDKTIQEIVAETGVSEFNKNCPKTVQVNQELLVSDFIQPQLAKYNFYYFDENGEKVNITGDRFSFANPGNYKLYYNEQGCFLDSMTLTVGNYDQATLAWCDSHNISLSLVKSVDENLKVVLQPGTATATMPTITDPTNSLGYVAYNGDYGIESYVVVDFVGKDMPQVSFFRDKYSNNIFDLSKGLLVSNSINRTDGTYWSNNDAHTMESRMTFYGPNMVQYVDNDGPLSFRFFSVNPSNVSRYKLEDGVNYRMICGFEQFNASAKYTVTYRLFVQNLDTGEIIENSSSYTSWAINGVDKDNNGVADHSITDEYFHGNIVLYGNYGREVTISKLYEVVTGVTFEDVVADYKLVKEENN